MSVTIKSNREIELMREAGRILALVHEEVEQANRKKQYYFEKHTNVNTERKFWNNTSQNYG